MHWEKLGRVFEPDHEYPWMATHAANPAALPLEGDRFRIYFSTRDEKNRSSIASLDISMRRPLDVLRISSKPVLSPGVAGRFDDSGVSLGCFTEAGGKRYLYYLGWNLGVTVPFRNTLGLAAATRDGSFKKYSAAPILDRSAADPYSLSYPFVLKEGSVYRMWYGSNLSWGPKTQDMEHVIKTARSRDGIHFERDGKAVLGLSGSRGEYALARPWVLKEKGLYRMWFSHRGAFYRIGYAESKDGLRWRRLDAQAGIGPSKSGWDSEAVCYASIFRYKNDTFMLYNGNGFGRTGFGLAVLSGGKSPVSPGE